MKIIKQTGIIFFICWISVILEALLPFAFPASVIGMVLLLLFLLSGLLKVEHIREKSDFLLANMAFFFIPAGVNVMNYLDILRQNWLPLLAVCLLTTVITFAATAYSVRFTMSLRAKRKDGQS